MIVINATINTADYRLLKDSYYGIGGYKTGAYLHKHKRESDEKYNTRLSLAYYLNYTAPTLNQHINPVFSKAVTREYNNEIFNSFINNVDGAGTYINDFMRRAATEAKLYGVTYIVIDNISQAQQKNNLAEVLKYRAFPYMYTVTPENVEEIKTDKYGNIIYFKFREYIDNDVNYDSGIYVTHIFTENYFECSDVNRTYSGNHNLGIVPVIAFKSRNVKDVIPPSEFLSIAKTNKQIFNYCSWLTEILQNQAFSILTMPLDQTQKIDNLVVGTNNMLTYPLDANNTPNFIAPPADPANMITGMIDRLIKEIYRQAGLSFATGVQNSQSGVSRAYDFENLNQILADFACICEATEYKIVELFSKWINQEIKALIVYKKNYNLSDIKEDIENAKNVLDLPVSSSKLKQKVLNKLLNTYMSDDVTDAEKKIILEEISEEEVEVDG